MNSKHEAESEVMRAAARGLDAVIVNPTFVLGPDDRGASSMGLLKRFLLRRIPAYVDGGLNIVDVRDVAAGHLLADAKGERGERYILGGRNFTLQRLFADLSRISGVAAPPLKVPAQLAEAGAAISETLGLPLGLAVDETRSAALWWTYSSAKAKRELGFSRARTRRRSRRRSQRRWPSSATGRRRAGPAATPRSDRRRGRCGSRRGSDRLDPSRRLGAGGGALSLSDADELPLSLRGGCAAPAEARRRPPDRAGALPPRRAPRRDRRADRAEPRAPADRRRRGRSTTRSESSSTSIGATAPRTNAEAVARPAAIQSEAMETPEAAIKITDVAAEKLKELLACQQESDQVLRVAVRGGGCSGFQYALALDKRKEDDHVFEHNGVAVRGRQGLDAVRLRLRGRLRGGPAGSRLRGQQPERRRRLRLRLLLPAAAPSSAYIRCRRGIGSMPRPALLL